jgi:hypothetical protein
MAKPTSELMKALANIEWCHTRIETLDSMLADKASQIELLRRQLDRSMQDQIALVRELAQANKSAMSLSYFLHS